MTVTKYNNHFLVNVCLNTTLPDKVAVYTQITVRIGHKYD